MSEVYVSAHSQYRDGEMDLLGGDYAVIDASRLPANHMGCLIGSARRSPEFCCPHASFS